MRLTAYVYIDMCTSTASKTADMCMTFCATCGINAKHCRRPYLHLPSTPSAVELSPFLHTPRAQLPSRPR